MQSAASSAFEQSGLKTWRSLSGSANARRVDDASTMHRARKNRRSAAALAPLNGASLRKASLSDPALAAEVSSGCLDPAAAVRDCSALADPADSVDSRVDWGCFGLVDLPWMSPSIFRATSLQSQSRPLAQRWCSLVPGRPVGLGEPARCLDLRDYAARWCTGLSMAQSGRDAERAQGQ